MLTGTNGILTQAQKAKMTTELSSYKEQLELYKTEKLSENRDFLESTLTVGKESLKYNTQPEGETGNIKTVIPSIKDEYIDKVEIIKGSLLINTQDKNEIEIAKSLGIAANPYDIVNGELLSSNGNLLLMDETGTLTIPDSVTKIGEGAFAKLDGLKTIIIPGTVKEIGRNAFAYNVTLEKVIMQDGIEIIREEAFQGCSNLKEIQMPNSVKTIGQSAFKSCSSLGSIDIPSGISEINNQEFEGCINLEHVNFGGENMTNIYSSAFLGCKSLKKLKITKNISSIAGNAFFGCILLSEIEINNNPYYIYENGMLMSKNKSNIIFISQQYYSNKEEMVIPNGIVNLDFNINFETIKSLEIPQSVKLIRPECLPKQVEKIVINKANQNYIVQNNCIYTKNMEELVFCYSKETEIEITEKIKIIQEDAVTGATKAQKIILSDSVEEIKSRAFAGLEKLEKLELGKNVKTIEPTAMYLSRNIDLEIDSENPNFTVENRILYTKNKQKIISVLYAINEEFVMNENVQEIGVLAFYNQNSMKSIKLSNNLLIIGGYSFRYCMDLTNINIPSSVTKIEDNAFSNCTELDQINIKKKQNSISGAPWGAPKGMKVVNWNG